MPLREILQRFSHQYLIVIRPRKGIFVAFIDYINIKSIFEVWVRIVEAIWKRDYELAAELLKTA